MTTKTKQAKPAVDVPAVDVPAVDVPAVDVPAVDALTISEVTADLPNALSVARVAVAESLVRGYGAMREYSLLLNQAYAFDWFNIEHTELSDEAKVIKAEKKLFYKALTDALHTNPSVVWARVRAFGEAERYPVAVAEPKLDEEGNEISEAEQGESGKDNAQRSPMLRNIEELSALYKFNNKQDNLDQRVIDAHKHIVLALEALGVNLSMIG